MLWRELRVAWRWRRGRGKKAPTYAAELGVQDFAEMTGLATIGARRPGLAAGELETRLRLLLRSTGLALMTHHMRPVLVPIELIVSLRADGPNTAKIQRPHERWRALARGGLHVTSVDCKHVEIVRAPGIPTIAQVLRSAIKRARETTQVV